MIFALGAVPPAWANQTDAADDDAAQATDQLVQELARFEGATANARAARGNALTKIAAQRREKLLKLIERNPKLAASRLIPKELRNRLPAEARDLIEQDVETSGEVSAEVSDDFKSKRSQTKFFLRTATEKLDLHLAEGETADLFAHVKKKVSLSAARINGKLLIRKKQDIRTAALGASSAPAGVSANVVSETSDYIGQKRVLAILVNFPGQAVECSASDVAAKMFGTGVTVSQSYFESSRGQLSLTGDVIGPFSIPYGTVGGCNKDQWANAANAAAVATGVDPSQYDLISYTLPRNATAVCPWDGLADIGNVRSWTRACMSDNVITHELGHNIGFHHADTPSEEYGDHSDPMGNGSGFIEPSGSTFIERGALTQFNGANRSHAGWVPAANVQQVIANGSHTLNALELSGASGVQVLKLYKPDTKEWYYVTLRQEMDLDVNLAQIKDFVGIVNGVPQFEPRYSNRVQIHRAKAMVSVAHTILLANLRVGESFSDTVSGITVTHQALAGTAATVNVAFTGATCLRRAPTVTVSPSSQVGAVGASRTYSLNVRNNDTAPCGPNNFVMSQTLPAGFTGMFHRPALPGMPPELLDTFLIEPGLSTTQASWTITAPNPVNTGVYTLRATAIESVAGALPATGQATYVVLPQPPVLTVTSPAPNAVLSGAVQLSATASHPDGIASVEFYLDNVLIMRMLTSPYSNFWPVGATAKGPHAMRVRATSRTGVMTDATFNVTVQ
jgi:hypothetical protein